MSVVMDIVSARSAGIALGFPGEILAQLRKHGLIAGDDKLIDLQDAARVVAELRAVMRPLQGNLILVSKAAKKYGFHSNSIYDWIRNGWVTVLVPEPRRQVDEGDIALARAIANKQGQVSGRAIFPAKPRSGRPRKQQP